MNTVTIFVIDSEQTGRSLIRHSMHWFAVMKLTRSLDTFFDGQMRPRPGTRYTKAALDHGGGVSWDEIQSWPDPAVVMPTFADWVVANTDPGTKAQFWADNNSHDLKWLSLYMDQYADEPLDPEAWHDEPDDTGLYAEEAVLGHSSKNVNNWHQFFVKGCAVAGRPVPKRFRQRKNLSVTKHTHRPLDDVRGVCESMLAMEEVGLYLPVAD